MNGPTSPVQRGPESPLWIDPAQLARLGSLPIQARVIVEGALSGLHRASVHGSSVEFAEHKEYSPGDELRHVDWKAYGKLDRYYVKQFEQESQLTVYLVLDASASMAFAGGGIAKLQYGGLALAALARIAELTRRRRALIILASDLFDADDDTLKQLSQLRAQRHDVSVLHILDPHERSFPYDGLTQFEALETDHKVLVNPAAIRRDYLDRMDGFLARVRGTLTAAGVDYHLVETSQPLEQTLLALIIARSRLGPARRAS